MECKLVTLCHTCLVFRRKRFLPNTGSRVEVTEMCSEATSSLAHTLGLTFTFISTSNHPTISQTSAKGKTLESTTAGRVRDPHEAGLIWPAAWVHRGRSCRTDLSSLYKSPRRRARREAVTQLTDADYWEAFDRETHKQLLKKNKGHAISEKLCKWIMTCLLQETERANQRQTI